MKNHKTTVEYLVIFEEIAKDPLDRRLYNNADGMTSDILDALEDCVSELTEEAIIFQLNTM